MFAATADEETGGYHGVLHLLEHEPELLRADVALTEAGGTVTDTARGPVLDVGVGEKGMAPMRLTAHGRAAHASTPRAGDNALVTAAEAIRRLDTARPDTTIGEDWRRWVDATVDDEELRALLLDEATLWDALPRLPTDVAVRAHACTHSTFTPTLVAGGLKNNIVPDEVTIELDVRIAPGESVADVERFVRRLLLDLPVRVDVLYRTEPSRSPVAGPIWPVLERAVARAHPGGRAAPTLFTGATDGRHLRAHGIPVYGFGVLERGARPGDVLVPIPRRRRAHRPRVAGPLNRRLDGRGRRLPGLIHPSTSTRCGLDPRSVLVLERTRGHGRDGDAAGGDEGVEQALLVGVVARRCPRGATARRRPSAPGSSTASIVPSSAQPGDDEAVAEAVDRLVVDGVADRARRGRWRRRRRRPGVEAHGVVDEAVVVDVLDERAAEGHVEHLVAAADGEQRQAELDGRAGDGEVERVVVGVDAVTARVDVARRRSGAGRRRDRPGRHTPSKRASVARQVVERRVDRREHDRLAAGPHDGVQVGAPDGRHRHPPRVGPRRSTGTTARSAGARAHATAAELRRPSR